MSNGVNNFYEFGGFRLDGKSGTLWRGDAVVSLSPKAADLLKLLVARTGDVVSKQEIFDAVWADTFVEDGVLTQNIYTLRNTLGPEFIETVPRRGYRFAGEIRVIPADESVPVGEGRSNGAFEGYDYEALSDDLLEDSREISDEAPRPFHLVRPASRRSLTRYFVSAVLAVIVLGVVGFGVYRFVNSGGSNVVESKIAPIEQIRFQSLTDTGDIIHPTISPDGATITFVRLEGEQSSVWVKQIATGTTIQILPPSQKGYRSLAFSPDGRYLYFRDEADPGAIYQSSPLGGTPRKVAENTWSDFSVSPDNSQLAFVRRDASRGSLVLLLSRLDGSGERELAVRPSGSGYRGGAPAWSPDGKQLAVSVSSTAQARPVLALVNVDTGAETELDTPQYRDISRILWTVDGTRLILAGRLANEATAQLWMLTLADGGLRRLTNDLEGYFWGSLSADGRTLVARQQRIVANLWIIPEGDIKRARQITSGLRNLDGYVGLTWTPSGKIVFTSRSTHSSDLFSISPEGGDRVQLTPTTGFDNTWPKASSDGRFIYFTSTRTGTRAIWRMDNDGGNVRQITSGDAPKVSAYSAAPAPDGSVTYFLQAGPGGSAIWKTSVDGGDAIKVSNLEDATAEGFLSVSPDGKWLAYQHVSKTQGNRNEDGSIRIGVMATDGSGEMKFFDVSVRRPVFHWTSDRTFDFSSGAFNSSTIWRQSIDGELKKLIDFPDRIFNFAWSPDGKDLVVSRGTLNGDAVLLSNLP